MANKTRSTFAKRQKELARQTKRKLKEAARLEKKAGGEAADGDAPEPDASTEDPDLIGITLGPQPVIDDDDDEDDEEKPDAHQRP